MTRLSSSALLAGVATLVLAATASAQPLTTRPATAPSATPPAVTTPSTPATPDPSATAPSVTTPVASANAGVSASFSDAQLSSFAAASAEIQPLTAGLATATPDQRTQTTAQIRAALARHNIDSATYNAIASAAQSDTALAARINAARRPG